MDDGARNGTAEIVLDGVSLDFPIYHGNSRSLKQTVFAAASGRIGRDAGRGRGQRVVVRALRDIGFTLNSGERLALVGGNGAGKTTLLRTIAGIYEPVRGRVRVRGTIGTLLDPGFGMNPELTGRENIRLRALHEGMGRAEAARLEDDVRDFAELGDFMELPVRFYSSGMSVRLGFGLATAIRPQVLVMDEWFLAGDGAFMDKAKRRLETLVRGADILVLSSHLEHVVREWATRCLWLEEGRVRMDGPADAVMDAYAGKAG